MTVVSRDCERYRDSIIIIIITLLVKPSSLTSPLGAAARSLHCHLHKDRILTKNCFDLLGQSRNPSPRLYDPSATAVARSTRPSSRNPLFPPSSSRPGASSPTAGILRGNPPRTAFCFHCFTFTLFTEVSGGKAVKLLVCAR